MYSIRWVTPRIRYTETLDDFENLYYDIDYNVWDFKSKHFKTALKGIMSDNLPRQTQKNWFTTEYDGGEERRFINFTTGEEDPLSIRKAEQFLENFVTIWQWRPKIKRMVLHDLSEFMNEDVRFELEFRRWYRQREAYRHPHFFRDYLIGKYPMGKEGEWREVMNLLRE